MLAYVVLKWDSLSMNLVQREVFADEGLDPVVDIVGSLLAGIPV
jgi:hypothetical protein